MILGTVQFGLPYGINNSVGQISEVHAFKILDYAAKEGITYIDTAAAYGNSERILGNYFESNNNHKFKVLTKFSFKNGLTCETSMLDSLEKLKVNVLDTIMFHSFEDYLTNKNQIDTLVNRYAGNKFINLGVSVYTNSEAESLLNDDRINTIQLPYNILDNASLRNDVFAKLKNAGKKIHTRSVFLQGLFLKDSTNFPHSLLDLVEPINKIKEIATSENFSVSGVALAYANANKYIDNILVGVDSLSQLQENCSFDAIVLNKLSLETLDKINITNPDLINPSKWKI